ncbi:MAG: hypothetical protein ACD_54C00222G0004 [uncultured bacterium]|nr:MAG: hypothetical protein ACD_54C00222G0004 [uncultured bacterium]
MSSPRVSTTIFIVEMVVAFGEPKSMFSADRIVLSSTPDSRRRWANIAFSMKERSCRTEFSMP